MTLEESIQYLEQVADSYKNTVPDCDYAKRNRQLAEWLRELKYYREECETFKVKNVIQQPKPVKTIMAIAKYKKEKLR